MPNWCSNHLSITGEKERMDAFKNRLRLNQDEEPELSFSAFVPTETMSQSIARWGTKWDLYPTLPTVDLDDELFFDFETAWSPPIEWLLSVSRIFPELEFRLAYFEPGMQFAGSHTIRGEEVEEEFYEEDHLYKTFILHEFDFFDEDEFEDDPEDYEEDEDDEGGE